MRAAPTDCAPPHTACPQGGCGAGRLDREPKAMSAGGSCGPTIRAAMAAGCESAPSVYPAARHSDSMCDAIWGPEALYRSACKCFKGVGRKHSTQSYKLHVISNTVNLAKAHRDGKYKEKPPKVVPIQYPKKRTAMSISLVDRVTQRSFNDLSLYPQATKRFIYANYACQKGKGTDAARKYYAAMLHRAWLKYGTADFRIVVVDVKGYYDNMDHETTNAMFAKMCDPWTAAQATRTLDRQYKGDRGYNPGSQMVQIAGISYLDRLDHYMKEVLRRKLYIRYMDDMHIVAKDEADAAHVMEEVSAQLKKVGLFAHPVKSRIVDAREGAVFLGFLHRVADGGKVLVSCDSAKVKANRRKMRRIANKIMRRQAHRTALAESWQSMYNHLAKGNSKRLERRMTEFYNNLEKEIEGAIP